MTAELTDRSALVVGGASGIGAATARLLAARGARVAVCGPDVGSAEQVAESIAAVSSPVIAVAADVRVWAEVDAAVVEAADRLHGLDILVCSAGIQRYGNVTDTETATWDDVFAVNVRGAFFVAKAALPYLRASAHAALALVSSVQAMTTQSNVAAYTASKGAINALARSMAVDEAEHGVRVNAVCPGSVDSPMLRESARMFSDGTAAGVSATLAQWGRAHPLGRIATTAEVAELIAFLVSDRASFITGESIRVDGGLTTRLAADVPHRGTRSDA